MAARIIRGLALIGAASLGACAGGDTALSAGPAMPLSHGTAAAPLVASELIPSGAAAQLDVPDSVIPCAGGRAGSIYFGPSLSPFAILAGTTVTNVGSTLVMSFADTEVVPGIPGTDIRDDLIGASPGSAITGFDPSGRDKSGPLAIYGTGGPFNPNRTIPQNAQAALTTVSEAAAARPATDMVAGDLSQTSIPGHPTGTLTPGVYRSKSSLSIEAGNLTLDGDNNPQSIFIFQVASSLTTTLRGGIGGNMILRNGAHACNVYWQVGSSATLSGSTFYGNVFAHTAITIDATTFEGRALAATGGVTMPLAAGTLIVNPGGS